jgi:hypothetical protein
MKETSYDFHVDIEKYIVFINNKAYYPSRGPAKNAELHGVCRISRLPSKPPKGNKNWFVVGRRNVFLYSDGEAYGIKMFGKCEHQRRSVDRLLFAAPALEKFSWQQVSKTEIEKLASLHFNLSKEGVSPLCKKEIINFNDGKFYGLRIEKIEGKMADWKDFDLGWKHKVLEAFKKAGVARKSRSYHFDGDRDFTSRGNVLLCSKTDRLIYVDIEWNHIVSDKDEKRRSRRRSRRQR